MTIYKTVHDVKYSVKSRVLQLLSFKVKYRDRSWIENV